MKILVFLIKENSKVKEFIFNPELNHRKKYIKTMIWLENIYKKAEPVIFRTDQTTNDISNETHNGYNLVRTESFEDLVNGGLDLIPNEFKETDESEETSGEETSTDSSCVRQNEKHSSE
jgi:hypothetical protein